jgi:TPR repeat protein
MPIDIVPFVLANAVFVSWACAIVLVGFTRWGGERRRLVIAITCAITLFCGGLYYYRYERIELRYGKAATAGDPEAQYRLAISLYHYGGGSGMDRARALEMMTSAASQKHQHAILAVASWYAWDCSPEMVEEAIEWFERAASQGHAESIQMVKVLKDGGVDWCDEDHEAYRNILEWGGWR